MNGLDVKYEVSKDFILRDIGDGTVLVPVGAVGELENSLITFNETYAYIWRCFETPHSISEVIESAKKEYDDPDGVMARQIAEASAHLIQRQVIKPVKE